MKRLKELRTSKGISQQELADMLHVSQQSIFKYEHDMAEPKLKLVEYYRQLSPKMKALVEGVVDE